ncbi:MAG: hypothetical protein KAS39_02245 [Actinomycetia bacterium]|nr:hypothetical protein [Actinomycetes bacterium]
MMKNWDFILVIITILLLTILGVISFGGTFYSYFVSLEQPDWTSTFLYQNYLTFMNYLAAPFALGIVIVLGLCIPKRVIPPKYSIYITTGIISLFALFSIIFNLKFGLGFLLLVSMFFQLFIFYLFFKQPGGLKFEKKGFIIQFGSLLLHLGIITLISDIILLQNSLYHLDIFWISTALIMMGTFFSFYPTEVEDVIKCIKKYF